MLTKNCEKTAVTNNIIKTFSQSYTVLFHSNSVDSPTACGWN